MTDVRERVLKSRYLLPEETESQMYWRVARFLFDGESHEELKDAKDLFELMEKGKFLPNSPTLVNASDKRSGSLSACYVLPIEDSLDGIYTTVHNAARVHKAFGGTGFDFSRIRPKGDPIQSTGGRACGPVKVLELLDTSANLVQQGGKREGANMGIIRCSHPDVVDFICSSPRHFNLSVSVDDEFMRKAHGGELDGYSSGVWSVIIDQAWRTGNPGLLFIDEVNRHNPTPELGEIEATNPCGEQPLLPYESCNLGSMNLSKYVREGPDFDLASFEEDVGLACRALDRVIDRNRYPIPEIEYATKRTRKIGLGVMGWHDCLILMGYSYCSDIALQLAREIGGCLMRATLKACPHNATRTTIAPTGTLSFLAGCSSGIEPVWDWVHTRTTEHGTTTIIHPLYDRVKGTPLEKEVALSIPWEWHIRHQSTWQQYIDNAVSKTVPLPHTATREDVEKVYFKAWKSGCKGITIYRDGSRESQVLSSPKVTTSKFTRRAGHLYEVESGCGKVYVWIDQEGGRLYEAFVVSAGGCVANNETSGRILSQEMQEGISVEKITVPLHKVKCINAMRNPKSQGKSCADIIGSCIDEEYRDFVVGKEVVTVDTNFMLCPSCGERMIRTEGCSSGTCLHCGWSGCA